MKFKEAFRTIVENKIRRSERIQIRELGYSDFMKRDHPNDSDPFYFCAATISYFCYPEGNYNNFDIMVMITIQFLDYYGRKISMEHMKEKIISLLNELESLKSPDKKELYNILKKYYVE